MSLGSSTIRNNSDRDFWSLFYRLNAANERQATSGARKAIARARSSLATVRSICLLGVTFLLTFVCHIEWYPNASSLFRVWVGLCAKSEHSNLLQQVAVAAEDACPSELSNVATKRFSHGTNERHDEHTVTAFEKNFSD
jgi:hypothetical protein